MLAKHVHTAPHSDCFVHAHVVTGRLDGCIVESLTDLGADPLQAELFVTPPRIDNGTLCMHAAPGLGTELNEDSVSKFSRRIL